MLIEQEETERTEKHKLPGLINSRPRVRWRDSRLCCETPSAYGSDVITLRCSTNENQKSARRPAAALHYKPAKPCFSDTVF
jgi:hypothetical protein